MDAKLIIVGGKANRRVVKLKLPTVIGRGREAQLTVAHRMVSRQHCELFEQEGLLKVRDLGSLNGTRVDGKRIKEAALCPDGEFTIGPLTFLAEYEYEGDLSSVPPPQFAEAKEKEEKEEPEVCSEEPGAPSSFDSGMMKLPDLTFLDEPPDQQTIRTPAGESLAESDAEPPDVDFTAMKEVAEVKESAEGAQAEGGEAIKEPEPVGEATAAQQSGKATGKTDDVPDFLAGLETDAKSSSPVDDDDDLAEFLKGFQ